MAPSLIERQLLRLRNAPVQLGGLRRPPAAGRARDLIWRRGTARLWRYRAADRPIATPVLIVHSLISDSSILDLLPDASMIGHLSDAGLDVFLLDWEPCGPADAENTLETYVDDLLADAVTHTRAAADSNDVTVIGYCLGGVLALLHAAGDRSAVRNLVTLTTPVAFSEMGFMSNMFLEGRLDPDDVIDDTGLVPAAVIDAGFRLVKPTDDLVQSVNVWEKLWDDRWLESYTAIGRWARHQLPFPGAAFRQIVATLIRDDALAGGSIELGGRSIALADVSSAVLNVFCTTDELVPPAAARPIIELVGAADRDELVLDCGHVGLVAGSAARAGLSTVTEWIGERSEPRRRRRRASSAATDGAHR